MIRQEIQEYIKKSKESGMTDEQIKDDLSKSGWQKEEIAENFSIHSANNQEAQKTKRSLKRTLIKIFIIFIGIIFLIAAFIYLFPKIANVITSDIAPPDDSDLQLPKVQIADSENAYFDLIKLEGNIVEKIGEKNLIDDLVANKVWDQAYVNELLKGNEKALTYFDQAAAKPSFQDPVTADPKNISPEMKITPMNSFRTIAKINSIKAANLIKQGKTQEALDESMKIVNIGYKIQNSQGILIHYLVGLAIEKLGIDRMQQIIQSANLSPETLIQYSQKLNSFKNHTEGLKNAFKAEHLNAAYITNNILSQSPEELKSMGLSQGQIDSIKKQGIYYFRPNETKKLFGDLARAWIKDTNCSANTSEAEMLVNKNSLKLDGPNSIITGIKLYFTENAIAKILFQIVGVSFSGASTRACNEDLNISATQSLMTIEAYKIQNGDYPLTLEALVPRYLSEIPKDPYNDQPLKYSKDKKIIYSVGSDKKDDGGSEGDDWTKMPDPTFKINF